MKKNIMIITSVIYAIIGCILTILFYAGLINEFWGGMGLSLLIVLIFRTIRIFRFNKNPEYREKIEVGSTDERMKFIRNKAWAWTGYVLFLTIAILVIVFRAIGQEMLSFFCAALLGFMLILYWVLYIILRKKY